MQPAAGDGQRPASLRSRQWGTMASSRLLLLLLLLLGVVVSVNCQRRKFGRKIGGSPQVGTAPKPAVSAGRRPFPSRSRGQASTSTRGTGQRGSAITAKPSRTFGSSRRTPSKPAPGRTSSRRNPSRGPLTTAKPLRAGSVRGRPASKVRGSSFPASRGRQAKSKPAAVGGRNKPPRFGTGRSTPSTRAGGRSTPSTRAGGRSKSSSFGTGRSTPSTRAGGRGKSSSFGGGRSSPSTRAGSRGKSSSFGAGRSTPSTRTGAKSKSSSFGAGRSKSSSFGRGRGTPSSRAGGRSKSSSFGSGRSTPSRFGGSKGKTSRFGGARDKTSRFGGAKDKSSRFGGSRGKSSSFGGGRGKSSSFGRGKGKKQSPFGRGQTKVRGSSSQNPRRKVKRPNSIGFGGNRRTQTTSQRKSKPKVDFKCPDKNGTYPHKKACDKYYWCVNGEAREESCPDGLYYHPDKVYPCVYPVEAECTKSSEPEEPSEECPRQFAQFRDTSSRNKNNKDCGSYTSCVGGIAYPSQCPAGLAFDSNTLTCEWADLVEECSDVAGYLGFKCPKRDFSAEEVGEFTREPHPKNCTFFYLCLNTESGAVVPRLQSCPDSMVFNSETRECTGEVDQAGGCGKAIDKNVVAAFRAREEEEQERREQRLAQLRAKFFS